MRMNMTARAHRIANALLFSSALALTATASATPNYFQGFESNTGDWQASLGISRTPAGGGTLHLAPSGGSYYAELKNLPDGYQSPGFGDGGYSFYGGADSTYHGAFFQAIDVYINAHWAPPPGYPTLPGFWIDMTPYHADINNYGAEHNFQITALGSAVQVSVDGQSTPIATLTNSGWYTFVMTYRRAPLLGDPVITDMSVYAPNHSLMGTTTVTATSPGGPFASADLRGNGYVWITAWQNGFANDVLGLDNQRTGLLPFRPVPRSKDECKDGGWQSMARLDNSSFKNQGDCIQYANTGR